MDSSGWRTSSGWLRVWPNAIWSSLAKDAWIIFGYTMDAIRQHRVHQTEPSADSLDQLVAFTYRALGANRTN